MTEPTHTLTEDQLAARDAAVTRRALQMAAHKVAEWRLKDEPKGIVELLDAILALQPAPTRWQEVQEGFIVVPVDKAARLKEFLQDWQVGRGGDYDQDIASFIAMIDKA